MSSRLQIVAVEERKADSPAPRQKTRREEIQATFERRWRLNPQQFDSNRSAKEKERIERTLRFLLESYDFNGKRVVDLGTGKGVIASCLAKQGAIVDAVDISTLALSQLPAEVNPVHDCMPSTTLPDDAYDFVLCLDLIAHLPKRDHRLFMAELSRLVRRDGVVVCSTPLANHTEDPLGGFLHLAETEFQIERLLVSYHALYPSFFNSRKLLLWMERLTRFWKNERGATHVIFSGSRKPMNLGRG